MRLFQKPGYVDALVLSVFTVLITLHPYYAHGRINMFEVGLYLPGIQAILDGAVPYRDFFHLRGPFELYMPALLMKAFGVHINVLYLYFYAGTVLGLILCVLIGKELYKTRFVLYLMVPVLIGRTFPRVVFTYWGGMRYALGLLTVWLMVLFFKKEKSRWLFWAGIATSCAFFTSVEMGVYPALGLAGALAASKIFRIQKDALLLKSVLAYLGGAFLVAVPFGIYLSLNNALVPFLDSVWTVVTRMQVVIDPHQVSEYPRNFPEAFAAMVNPVHTNFKHMTPSYLYIIVLGYLLYRVKSKRFEKTDLAVFCLAIYGFIMYNTAFRGIWAAQFEMALQPDKILLFFILEILLLTAIERKKKYLSEVPVPAAGRLDETKRKVYAINAFILILTMSSLGYAIQRYNHRFFAFKFLRNTLIGKETSSLRPFQETGWRALSLERGRGVIVPEEQADELEQIDDFARRNLRPGEPLMTYPELGTYNFFVDRPFVGRFALVTFSWFNDRWHEEYMRDLSLKKPRYIVLEKDISGYWKAVYLAPEANRQKFNETMDFIDAHYARVAETRLSFICKLKE